MGLTQFFFLNLFKSLSTCTAARVFFNLDTLISENDWISATKVIGTVAQFPQLCQMTRLPIGYYSPANVTIFTDSMLN